LPLRVYVNIRASVRVSFITVTLLETHTAQLLKRKLMCLKSNFLFFGFLQCLIFQYHTLISWHLV